MRDYSLRYLDQLGRSAPSDFLKFADDASATLFARAGLARNAVVEVWKGSVLVVRLDAQDRDAGPGVLAGQAPAGADGNDTQHAIAGAVNILPLNGIARPAR